MNPSFPSPRLLGKTKSADSSNWPWAAFTGRPTDRAILAGTCAPGARPTKRHIRVVAQTADLQLHHRTASRVKRAARPSVFSHPKFHAQFPSADRRPLSESCSSSIPPQCGEARRCQGQGSRRESAPQGGSRSCEASEGKAEDGAPAVQGSQARSGCALAWKRPNAACDRNRRGSRATIAPGSCVGVQQQCGPVFPRAV